MIRNYFSYLFRICFTAFLTLSFTLAGIPSGAWAAASTTDFKNEKPTHQAFLSPADRAALEKMAPDTRIRYSYDGVDYSATYRKSDCSSGECEFFADEIIPEGFSLEGASSPGLSIRPYSADSSSPTSSGTGSGKSTAIGSGQSNGQGNEQGSSRTNSGSGTGGSQDSGKGSSRQQGNADAGNGNGLTDSFKNGVRAGLLAGGMAAAQDYLIMTPGSQKELQEKQQAYEQAAHDANQAYADLRDTTSATVEDIAAGINDLKQNLPKLQKANANFGKFISGVNLNQAPSTHDIRDAINSIAGAKNVRPDFVKRSLGLVDRLDDAPRPYSTTVSNFKKITAASLNAATQSEVRGDYDISDANLEMAKVAADVLFGLDPYTGFARDLYEMSTGLNIVTDQPLSTFERAISVVGVTGSLFTLGASSSISNSIKASYRVMVAGTREGNAVVKAIKALEKSKDIIRTLKEMHLPIRSGLTKAADVLRKGLRKINPGEIQEVEKLTVKLAEEGIASGRLKKMTQLSEDLLRNPMQPEAFQRMQEVAVDGIKFTAKDVVPGTNGKVALIGRNMDRIREYATELKNEGFNVEIFDRQWMIEHHLPPTLGEHANLEFANAAGAKGWVEYNKVKTLEIYAENKKWITSVKDEGYTIINTGIPSKGYDHPSALYDIELEITGLGR